MAVEDGDYSITFKLYTTESGGTPVWSETQSDVEVVGGVYGVQLGSVTPLNIPFDQVYYLGLTVSGGAEHFPRTKLTAAPYALSLLGQDNRFPSTGMVKMSALATGTDITTATSYTVGDNDHVIYLDHTANQNVTLPAATTANTGRQLLLVNKEAVAKTLTSSNYVNLAGATSTTVPATGVVELQSDGSVWRQTGGYVQPVSVGKAFVRCKVNNLPNSGNVTAVVPYTEINDAQNCWNTTTTTFTAPRTGTYRISSSFNVTGVGNLVYVFANTSGVDETVWYANLSNSSSNAATWSVDFPMTANQTFQVRLYNNSPGGVITIAASSGFLTITEI